MLDLYLLRLSNVVRAREMLSKKELKDLRPWVAETVQKTLGYSQDALVITALDCISKNLSRQSATGETTTWCNTLFNSWEAAIVVSV